jgi:AcrR family transcriptional regulator
MPSGALAAHSPAPRRAYRSPARAEQAQRTRRRILAAASAEFLAAGYAPTTMRAVAAAAGVSLATVELAFGSKAQLLKAAIDVAVAGDDQPTPMLGRAWAARAQLACSLDEFLTIVSRVLVESARRAAGLALAAFEAAQTEPTLRPLASQLAQNRAAMATWIVDGVMRRSQLHHLDRAEAIDTVWVLMDPAVFCHLVRDRAWTPERFEGWFLASVRRLLVAEPHVRS